MRRFHPSIDELESRTLQTMVFIFNGNGYAEAKPDPLHTQLAADLLAAHGETPIQMTTPAMDSPAAFYGFANEILAISKGKPIALMGFSAGAAWRCDWRGLPNCMSRPSSATTDLRTCGIGWRITMATSITGA